MTKVFISYKDDDRDFAEWIKGALTHAGIATNLDDSDPDAEFAPGIRKAVETADALVVIVSEKGVSDSNVGLEIGMATGLGKKVVAVVAPDAEPDPALLRSIADAYILDAARHKQNEVGAELRKALQGEQITDRHTSA